MIAAEAPLPSPKSFRAAVGEGAVDRFTGMKCAQILPPLPPRFNPLDSIPTELAAGFSHRGVVLVHQRTLEIISADETARTILAFSKGEVESPLGIKTLCDVFFITEVEKEALRRPEGGRILLVPRRTDELCLNLTTEIVHKKEWGLFSLFVTASTFSLVVRAAVEGACPRLCHSPAQSSLVPPRHLEIIFTAAMCSFGHSCTNETLVRFAGGLCSRGAWKHRCFRNTIHYCFRFRTDLPLPSSCFDGVSCRTRADSP